MATAVQYGSLPFNEQIEFFKDKLNVKTQAWTDIWSGMHSRAFVVAGAMKDDLLVDLRGAVDKVIADGVTLQQFRKDFDVIVDKHGWSYKGGRGWRTRVIYETNLRASYMAGRYRQLTDPDALEALPYWQYRHSDLVNEPREEHLAWDGLVLRADDPWWDTHFPPNGWGCMCTVDPLSEDDLKDLGKSGPDTAPPINYIEKTVGSRGPSPRTVMVPEGIDPGWDYNVGETAWGRPLSDSVMDEWRAAGADAWENLTPNTFENLGRPDVVPLDDPVASLISRAESVDALADSIRTVLGGEEKTFEVHGLPVYINADSLAAHVDLSRSPWAPFITETMNNPYEVWLTFERHKGTGQVALRSRIIKGIDIGRGQNLLMVLNARRGMLEGWTFIPSSNQKYIDRQRQGLLIYGRGE